MTYLIPFLAFWFGYLLGRMDQIINLLKNRHSNKEIEDDSDKPKSFLQQAKIEEVKKSAVVMDESKFVTRLDNSFEKNFKKLGKETVTKDNVDSSVSKLAQLKKK